MTRIFRLLLILAGIVCVTITDVNACTTFQIEDGENIYVGKNYDWGIEEGLIVVNQRGVSKTAMRSVRDNSEIGQPAVWTSKYGSITFNQYGRELPAGGMNEAGLVIETMALSKGAAFPEPDSRPSVTMHQWVQYQLDTASSVAEVIVSDSRVRIRRRKSVHTHFLVSDSHGACAVIEFIKGRRVVYNDDSLPFNVLSNSTYKKSVNYMKKGKTPWWDRFKSIERFIRAASMLNEYQSSPESSIRDYSFEILKSVEWSMKRKNWFCVTRWSIVYDISNLQIFFRTFGNQKIRSIDLKSFDFGCGGAVKVLEINNDLSGDVTKRFVDYTRLMNRNLIENSYTKTYYIPKIPSKDLDEQADYPDTLGCAELSD